MEKIRKQIVEIIKRSDRILVMPSAPPDGDSLGSALALYLVLKKLGKEVTVCMAEPVPDAFQFLPTTKVISNEFSAARDFIVTLDCKKAKLKSLHSKLEQDKVNIIVTAKSGNFSAEDVSFIHGPSKYDIIITVDTGDLEQLGRFYEDNTDLFTKLPLINIDHHASNSHFGRINYVDVMASATTEIIIPLIQDLEHESGVKLMDEDVATLLLAGIITDTGSFQNANTTPRSFASSAQLIKYGARQQEIIQHVFKTKHLSTLRLWGRILSNIRVDQKHHFVWSTISKKDFNDTSSKQDETGGIIDELMTNAPGTEIVVLLKERPDGVISGSVRTTSDAIDASEIAAMFGGGGHVRAAGFKIPSADLTGTERHVVEKVKEFQKKRLHIIDDSVDMNTVQNEYKPPIFKTPEFKKPIKLEQAAEIEKSTKPLNADEIEKDYLPSLSKLANEIDKQTPNQATPEEQEENFTDIIIKKAGTKESGEAVEIQPGMIYKFED